MNTVLILLMLCGGFHFSHGEKLKCSYFKIEDYYHVGTLYSCYVSSLDNSYNTMTIDGYTATHLANKNDKDVNAIYMVGTNTKYIPEGLGSLSNLLALVIQSSQLVEIRAENFLGMENLEYLGLWTNEIKYLPSDVFSSLKKLKVIYLYSNQIKNIGSGAFDKQTNLINVYLSGNVCVHKDYSGTSAISQMKEDIKAKCYNPNDPHEIIYNLKQEIRALVKENDALVKENNKTTDLNFELVELSALKQNLQHKVNKMNEMKKVNTDFIIQLDAAKKIIMKKNLNESKIKFEYETIEQKNKELMKEIDALMINHDALVKDGYAMKMELEELNKKFETNCKQTTEAVEAENIKLIEINQLLLKAFQNHQTEYHKIVKLEADLSKAKDEQNTAKKTIEQTISNKCNSFTMNCNFLDTNGAYTCETRNLIINQKEMELCKVYGTHLKSKSNQNVTELVIVKSSMSYWSNDIFTKFPALQTLRIQNAQLNEFKKGDFSSAFKLTVLVVNGNNIKSLGDEVFHGTEEHLTEININSNQIEKFSNGTFRGLKQLKFLSMKDNLITEIPFGSFKDIVMLEILILTGNKIKFLDGKVLEFNRRLMTFAVDQNELREVGEEILDYSVMLNDVNFEGNDCIDERATIDDDDDTDGRTIIHLIFVIRNFCKNSAEALNIYNW